MLYRVALVQSNRVRSLLVFPENEGFVGIESISFDDKGAMLISKPYEKADIDDYIKGTRRIASISLENGASFSLDAHGIWLLDREAQDILSGSEIIRWNRGIEPDFPEV